MIASLRGSPEYVEMVKKYEVRTENSRLLDLAIAESDKSLGRNAAGLLLEMGGGKLAWKTIQETDTARSNRLLAALGGVGSKESLEMLQSIVFSEKYPMELRKSSRDKLGRSRNGEDKVLQLLKTKKIPHELIPDVVQVLVRHGVVL